MPKGCMKGMVCDTCGGPLGTRNTLGRCIRCRTAAFKRTIKYLDEPDPATMERILYYQERAALGLETYMYSLPNCNDTPGQEAYRVVGLPLPEPPYGWREAVAPVSACDPLADAASSQ
jgi:hypothetical protein